MVSSKTLLPFLIVCSFATSSIILNEALAETPAPTAHGVKSISLEDTYSTFANSTGYQCEGSAENYAICRPKSGNDVFETYGGIPLAAARIEFFGGTIASIHMFFKTQTRNIVTGEKMESREARRISNAIQSKYGAPVVESSGNLKIFSWQQEGVEIFVEPEGYQSKSDPIHQRYGIAGFGRMQSLGVVTVSYPQRAAALRSLRAEVIEKERLAAEQEEAERLRLLQKKEEDDVDDL